MENKENNLMQEFEDEERLGSKEMQRSHSLSKEPDESIKFAES